MLWTSGPASGRAATATPPSDGPFKKKEGGAPAPPSSSGTTVTFGPRLSEPRSVAESVTTATRIIRRAPVLSLAGRHRAGGRLGDRHEPVIEFARPTGIIH